MTTRVSRSRPSRPASAGSPVDAPTDPVADKLQALHDTLTAAVADLATGDAWQRMLRTAALFHRYSPHNVLLITAQCPHAQAVAGYQTWKQLDRQVRKGEQGIAILAPVVRRRHSRDNEAHPPARDEVLPSVTEPPSQEAGQDPAPARRLSGFRVVHVFDISQTDGRDLPTPPRPDLLDGEAPQRLAAGLIRQVEEAGFTVSTSDFTALHPGLEGANGVTDFLARTVQVRPGLSDAQACKTLAHELGHVLLHEPATRPAAVTRDVGEVEAESVAYIVAAAHGLDTTRYTVPYVAGWAAGDLDMLRSTAERVLSTARRVLSVTPPDATFTLPDSVRTATLPRTPAQPRLTGERQLAPAPDRTPTLTATPRGPVPDLAPLEATQHPIEERDLPGQGELW